MGGRGGVMLVVVVQIFHHRPQTPSDLDLTPHPWPLRSWHRSLIHGLSVMHEALNHDLKTRTRTRTRMRTFHIFSTKELHGYPHTKPSCPARPSDGPQIVVGR